MALTDAPTESAERRSTLRTVSAREWALAAGGVALGLAAMAVDHLLGDDPGLEDPPTFAISAATILVVAAFLFGFVLPRVSEGGRGGAIVAVLAVLSRREVRPSW